MTIPSKEYLMDDLILASFELAMLKEPSTLQLET
jgi:hypothetical protein